MPTWPSSLPPPLVEGFTEAPAESVVSSQADTGIGKTRLRSTAIIADISVVYAFNQAQFDIFKDFYITDLVRGVLSYQWTHPVTGDVVRARMIGKYSSSPRSRAGLWRVSFNLKVLR